ncbi:MAG: RNA polymerase sigma factor [Lachnospiraceae bacterium]|nr:RNA polymerase sigma factor [Lachnospiraceae bacterium]
MDDKILSQFYMRYSREIYLYLYSMSHDRMLSEDLMQETFLKALLSLYDQHANVRAWLYVVARNQFYDYKKTSRKQVHYEALEDTLHTEEDLIAELISSEQKRSLYFALSHLDGRKREILVLQYYSELSQKEIARLMHLSLENVRVLAYRGKRELKKYLEENGYEIS